MIEILNINVDEIQEIKPQHEVRKSATMIIKVVINEHQLKNIFTQIWSNIGDEGIKDLLNSEGYSLVKETEKSL